MIRARWGSDTSIVLYKTAASLLLQSKCCFCFFHFTWRTMSTLYISVPCVVEMLNYPRILFFCCGFSNDMYRRNNSLFISLSVSCTSRQQSHLPWLRRSRKVERWLESATESIACGGNLVKVAHLQRISFYPDCGIMHRIECTLVQSIWTSKKYIYIHSIQYIYIFFKRDI